MYSLKTLKRGHNLIFMKDWSHNDLWSGDQLLEVTFSCGLTSITVDLSVTNVYVGCSDGTIKTFSLLNPPRSLSLTLDQNQSNTFTGNITESYV